MKRLYLTKLASGTLFHYIGDPEHPHTTFDVGLVEVTDRSEIRVDHFGSYVERSFLNSPETEERIANIKALFGALRLK